jgi:pentatricopeptide repeat protein
LPKVVLFTAVIMILLNCHCNNGNYNLAILLCQYLQSAKKYGYETLGNTDDKT